MEGSWAQGKDLRTHHTRLERPPPHPQVVLTRHDPSSTLLGDLYTVTRRTYCNIETYQDSVGNVTRPLFRSTPVRTESLRVETEVGGTVVVEPVPPRETTWDDGRTQEGDEGTRFR